MHFLVSRDGPNAISIEPYRWARLTKFGMDRMRILKELDRETDRRRTQALRPAP